MIDSSITKFLEENEEIKLSQENQEKYKKILLNNGVNANSALIDLMGVYSGDFYGEQGFMLNLAEDLSDYNNSITKKLIEKEGIDSKYLSLSDLELENYLLYNKENDGVVFIEAGNISKLKNNEFTKSWDNFNAFLKHYFEII
jgi:hypothetical protein